MRIRTYFALLLCFILCSGLSAQTDEFDPYITLRSSGNIPESFLQLSSQKVEQQKESTISGTDTRNDQRAKEQFLVKSNFVIDEMLVSGRVLFNDPVGEYVNKIADYVLRDLPELRQELQFYVVKSTAVNAFSTNQGIVFVNLGLIAHVHSEAELAFVLCHEIQHYIKQHPINKYVESKKIVQGRGLYGNLSFNDMLLARNTFSREQETEADLEGLKLYLNTAYDPKASDGVFDVLRDANCPIQDEPFPKSFFETKHLVFPDHYFLAKTSPYSGEEDYDDTLTSHPNVSKRRKLIAEQCANAGKEGGVRYLFGEPEFKRIQKICRYEMTDLYVRSGRYEEALYHSFLMLKLEPGDGYHRKAIGRSLYALAKYRNAKKFFELHTDFDVVEGEGQQLYYFLENLNDEELNALALAYVWELRSEYPKDEDQSAMASDLIIEMVDHHRDFLDSLYIEPRTSARPVPKSNSKENSNVEESEINGDSSEVETREVELFDSDEADDESYITRDSQFDESIREEEEAEYIQYVFVDLFQDDQFVEEINEAKSTADEKEAAYPDWNWEEASMERKNRLKGVKLGLDKVVFVKPFYSKMDQRKEVPIKYMDSETAESDLNRMLRSSAEKVGLEIDLLDPQEMDEADSERFNDMVILNDWLSERLEHGNMGLVPVKQEEVIALKDKYGTNNFAWTGIIAVTGNKNQLKRTMVCLYGCATGILAPYAIYYYFAPDHDMYQFTLVFDIETGIASMADFHEVNFKDSETFRKSVIYSSVLQMAAK